MAELIEKNKQEENVEIVMEEEKISNGDVEENEEVDESIGQDVDILLQHGILPEEIEKLKLAGLNTIKGVEMTTTKELFNIKGIKIESIDKIKIACSHYSLNDPFITATKFLEQRKQIFQLSTGSRNLDALLGGGIEAMSITEVYGEFGSGKTQLSHTLCVTTQMPGSNGYMGGKVIFIDTEHTFRPDRLNSIAKRFNLNEATVLQNILYTRAYNSEHQFNLLNKVANKLHESPGLFKLLIIDSVMALFRVDFVGQRELINRQQKLGKMLSRLQKISEEYNIAVFVTNQTSADVKSGVDEPKPVGGHTMAHSSTTRISFKKLIGNNRLAKLCDSPNLEQNEVKFAITSGGIDDPID